jgi:D-alanyl-D-alanine carboxypeptidase
MARKSTPKVDDVYLTLDKYNVESSVNEHPSVSEKTKAKMKEQNEKAAEDVANSQSSVNVITIDSPDYNSTGDDFENSEGSYVKKVDNNNPDNINDSTYQDFSNEQEEKKEKLETQYIFELKKDTEGEIIKTKKDTKKIKISTNLPDKTYLVSDGSTIEIVSIGTKRQAVATRPNQEVIKGPIGFTLKDEVLVSEMLIILSNKDGVSTNYTITNSYKENKEEDPNIIDVRPVKESPFGSFQDSTLGLTENDNTTKFEILKGDSNVDIYNGEGKRLGSRPLVSNNKFSKPIIQDFYSAIARLDAAANIDKIKIRLIRAYMSYQEQIEIRRKYAPQNQKSNDKWLETTESDSGFKNENGDDIKVNKPGYGYHILGNTFDINVNDMKVYEWLVKNAHNYGFYRTIPNELWHWEYKPWLYRLGGIENPTKPTITNANGGWKNESWQKLYTKLTDTLDPKGPKFLPNNHPSWIGFKGEIKGDTVNTIQPFISSQESGTTLNFADLVVETPPGSGDGIPEDDRQLLTSLQQIYNEKGYTWFNGILELNLIGVRGTVDSFYCIYKDKNNKQIIKKYNITTKPGKDVLSNPQAGGAAILVPGQYPVYKLGFHGDNQPYLAFWQLRGNMKIAKDNNQDEIYDYNTGVQSGKYGINIHKTAVNASDRITNWSEGCQVFSSTKQWEDFIEIARRSAEKQGESYSRIIQAENTPPEQLLADRNQPSYQFGEFTYTLLNEIDF